MDLSNLLNGIEPSEDQKALPTGIYNFMIEGVEAKTNKDTGAKGVSLKLRVHGEDFNNYCLFDYMLISGNENALKYSLPKLKKIGFIFGSENTEAWLGQMIVGNVSVDNRDPSRNIIWSYSAYRPIDNAAAKLNFTAIKKDAGPVFTPDDLPF